MRKIAFIILILVMACLLGGAVYAWQNHHSANQNSRSNSSGHGVYIDKNGCAQSHGGVHPDYCIHQAE